MKSIFVAGGALPGDHPTYVERQADQNCLRAALNGDYIHIVAPRQIGKTSLLKRLAARLQALGWRCAYVDLSTLMDFPKALWYAELGKILASSLTPGHIPALTNQVDLRYYLLDQGLAGNNAQRLIALFFDEVEGAGRVRDTDGTAFSDTFLMALRNLYIQRDSYTGTIIVALAGAINPAELVKDPNISPFNVGQEIDLEDFTATETRALTDHLTELGLPIEEDTHAEIYSWTNGHPYLTQRLCAELETAFHQDHLPAITSGVVTQIVNQAILNPTNPVQRDKNLRHVARLLQGLAAPTAQIWQRLLSGEALSLAEISDFASLELYLTGAAKAQAGQLVIRNQIYAQAFAEKIRPKNVASVDRPPAHATDKAKPIRIFVSSTWQDLQPERQAVENALYRLRNTAYAGMEYFGSRPETPRAVSLHEVEHSDVYIGIFAHRYGSGITEAEYRQAQQQGLACLIYIKDDDVPVPPAYIDRDSQKSTSLDALKNELRAKHTISLFKSPDHLATQIVADLHNLFEAAPSWRNKRF